MVSKEESECNQLCSVTCTLKEESLKIKTTLTPETDESDQKTEGDKKDESTANVEVIEEEYNSYYYCPVGKERKSESDSKKPLSKGMIALISCLSVLLGAGCVVLAHFVVRKRRRYDRSKKVTKRQTRQSSKIIL